MFYLVLSRPLANYSILVRRTYACAMPMEINSPLDLINWANTKI